MNCYTIFVLAVIALAKVEADSDVETILQREKIIPDIISSAPAEVLQVRYEQKEVQLGNELTPTEVKNPPTIQWKADPKAYYLLIMTDPDAPSRQDPMLREFLHWMVGNIPGDNIKMGETLMKYIGAGPPKDSGLHRYVFIIYKQPQKITFNEPFMKQTTANYRSKFSTHNFAKKHNLQGPEAVNFYQAKYDNYVPVIQSQL